MNSTTALHTTVLNRVTEFVINNSVLYYLSCCLLLLGAYSMMHAPWLSVVFLTKYCEIYSIFLLYLVLLAGLCLIVFRRLRMAEDGLVMAGLVLLLMLDPTSFNNVFYTYNLRPGLGILSFAFVLNVTVYATLRRIGGIPGTRTSAVVTVLGAGFVYYHPIGLNAVWAEAARTRYFYLLWWMPLLLATFCERILRDQSTSQAPGVQPQQANNISNQTVRTVVSARLERRFRVACVLIVFCMVIAHLVESNWAYSLDFHAEYLAPVFLAAGLLHFKLSPTLGKKGERFLWIYPVLAVCCSLAPTEASMIRLPWIAVLSSFHYGFAAVALFCLYFWRTYRTRFWATSAVLCLTFMVSGTSISDSLFHINHFRPVPFAFLAVVFIVGSFFRRSWIFPTLAGACLLISILALTPIQSHNKFAIFMQVWTAWTGVVHWFRYKRDHPQVYSLLGAFILSLSSLMFCLSPDRLVWGIDYLIVITALFLAGWFLEHRFLSMLAVFGVLGSALYLTRNQLISIASEFHRLVDFGLLATVMAFLILPLAYLVSVVRVRRREQTQASGQPAPQG